MIFLELPDLLHVARRVVDTQLEVRDVGLLESALARPRATAFGRDAYPSLHQRRQPSCTRLPATPALVDGNKRLALAATIAFDGLNGFRLTQTNDEAYRLIMEVSSDELQDVSAIADILNRSVEEQAR